MFLLLDVLQHLLCTVDKRTGEKSKTRPRFIKQDQIAIVRLETQQGVICLESFKDFAQMGRFTLRDEGTAFFDMLLTYGYMKIYRYCFKVGCSKVSESE